MKVILYFVCLCGYIGSAAIPLEDSTKLHMGQIAPPIQIETWLKGNPIQEFEKGKVYVLEFGFIACGPCRAAVPHLSDLAGKYQGQIQIASIFVYENSKSTPGKAYVQKVKNFIAKQGDKIKYAVAVDTEQQTMAATWYESAARSKMLGFPALFIIDRQGRIAWFGSVALLEIMLERVVNDDFDPSASAAFEMHFNAAIKRINQATQKKDWISALLTYDSLIQQYPTFQAFQLQKFDLLLKHDLAKAISFGRYLLSDPFNENEPLLSKMVDLIVSKFHDPYYAGNEELFSLVTFLNDRALVLCKSLGTASSLKRLMAIAYSFRGDYASAIFNMQQAIDLFNQDIPQDIQQAQGTMDAMLNQLKIYQAKAREKGP